MIVHKTDFEDLFVLEPRVFGDERGYFFESFNQQVFYEKVIKTHFVQDNESRSVRGVLRGLHYQLPPFAQSKLVRVIKGQVLDIALDIRVGSPTFGKHFSLLLDENEKKQVFIPRGFAHGFLVLSDQTVFAYKCDNYYDPDYERCIDYKDRTLGIDWGISHEQLIISEKDQKGTPFMKAEYFTEKEHLYAQG